MNYKIRSLIGVGVVMLGLGLWLSYRPGTPKKESVALRTSSEKTSQLLLKPKTLPVESRDQALEQVYQAPVSDLVGYVLGWRGNADFKTRLAALHRLPNNLSPGDLSALLQFLQETGPAKKLNDGQLYALKNDVMNLLRSQIPPPVNLAATFLALHKDPAQPEAMRDYALQHLAAWYQDKASAAEKTQIETVLWQGAEEHKTTLPGTSLLALYHISQNQKDLDRARLQQAAYAIAVNAQADIPARVTALQVAALLHDEKTESVALALAQSATTPLSVRISAIAALGYLGDPNQQVYLKTLAKGSDPLLSVPAQAALKRMEGKEL